MTKTTVRESTEKNDKSFRPVQEAVKMVYLNSGGIYHFFSERMGEGYQDVAVRLPGLISELKSIQLEATGSQAEDSLKALINRLQR